MNLKKIKVDVINKNNKLLSPTNALVANTLIRREKAVWVSKNKIKLLEMKQDWIKLKTKIIKKEHRTCYICGRIIPQTEHATIDHVNPKSRYGKDTMNNLHCCCKRCNDDKANMTIKEYYNHILLEKKNNKYDYIDIDKIKKYLNR